MTTPKANRATERTRCPACHGMVAQGHKIERFGEVVVHDRCAPVWRRKQARRG